MQYLLMIYDEEARWNGLSKAAQDAETHAFGVFGSDNGKAIRGGKALQPTSVATTVRVRDGKTLITDGPFAETKEQLGGFYLIEANNLDEATAIAAQIPWAQTGSIEVRPIMTFRSELDRCRSYVKETGEAVLRATAGLSPAQWNFKPGEDRWSIAEIVEHMVVVQELVLGPIREQLAQAPVCEGREYAKVDEIIVERFPVRSARLQAPEPARPTSRFTPDESLERLIANCGRLREYVETNPDLRLRVIPSRPLTAVTQGEFTEMDGYQWVLGVAAHTKRHTEQIGEVKGAVGYPG